MQNKYIHDIAHNVWEAIIVEHLCLCSKHILGDQCLYSRRSHIFRRVRYLHSIVLCPCNFYRHSAPIHHNCGSKSYLIQASLDP